MIIHRLVALALEVLAPSEDARSLRETAPEDLRSDEVAAVHLAAARLASIESDVPDEMVLSIAWFESRYTATAVTAEPRRKQSCGVMTPIPRPGRCAPPSILSGYREGAAHLRTWLDTPLCRGSMRCALLGYAGGGALIRACRRGPYVVQRGGRDVDLCSYVPDSRMSRARRIRRSVGV